MRKHHPNNDRIKRNYLAHLEEPAISLLDKADATALTLRIRSTVDGLWNLLLEAHDRKAWKALEYKTWDAYVKAEFGIGKSRSYQLIDHATFIEAERESTGDLSTNVDVSEGARAT